MPKIEEVLRRVSDGGYERHMLASTTPVNEGWIARCGRTIFRSQALLPHPLLPARPCNECAGVSR